MGYYLALMCIYGIFAIIETNGDFSPRSRKILCFVLLFPLWAMTAFRAGTVGNDTVNYIRAFNYMGRYLNLGEAIQRSRMEAGYVALSYLFAKRGASYLFFQAATNAFVYWSLWRFIAKYSSNIGFSCFIFLAMRMFAGPMNTIRMWLAIAVLLFSVPYLLKKKLIPFVIFNGIASLFHSSAFAFVLLYPICNIEFIKKNKWLIILAAIVIGLLGITFFEWLTGIIGKYEGYLDSQYFVDFNKTAIYLSLAIDLCFGLLFYLTRPRKYIPKRDMAAEKTGEYNITEIFSLVMIIILAFDIVGLTNTIMSRVSGYFGVFYMLMIPFRLKKLQPKNSRMAISGVILLLLALQWIVVMVYRPGWNGVTPFVWAF